MNREQLIQLVPEAGWRQAMPTVGQAALLVIDMQEYFRSTVAHIIPPLTEFIAVCRHYGIPVIYTQHGHDDPEQDGGMLSEWWNDHIRRGSDEAVIIPEMQPLPGDRIIAKSRYSAFYRTDLEEHLTRSSLKDIMISGVMTNLCCETTARDAFVRDFRVFFLADGTATAGHDYHIATLRNLAYGFAYLITCDQIIGHLTAR